MAVVGSAEVVVRAITAQVKRDVEKAFRDAMPEVNKAGNDAAKEYAKGFGNGLGGGELQNALDKAFGGFDPKGAAGKHGRDYVNALADSVRGGGGRVADEAERVLGGAGRRGGGAFNRFLDSAWADAAVKASKAFNVIYAMGNILGTAFSGLIGALSAVVSGLFAIASSASVAAGALAVLPGMIGALLQGGIALKLAFSGVGKAVSAGMKPADDAAKKTLASTNAVADAQKALARAYQDAARSKYDADKRVADAARDVADAEQEALDVTKQLTQARRDAAEQLQQLAFDAEDAALAEERAQLTLEKAFIAYQQTKADPGADERSKREAELAFKEAELSYRQAKDRNSDLAEEQKNAAKAGIEGSKEVLDAKQDIADAEDKVANKQQALADAQLARQRALQDSAQRIADAQQAVARAQAQAADAAAKASASAKAYQTALNELSPSARAFVKYLVSMKDEFKSLKAAAGEDLFPKLQSAMEPIVNKLFPVFEEQLKTTGGILGDYAIGISNAATRGTILRDLMEEQNKTLDVFNQKGANGRTVMDDLATVLLRVMTAIQPLTQRFAGWIAKLVEGWEAATNTKKEMNGLAAFFDKAGNRAALLGSIIGNLIGIIVGLGKSADPAGTGLLKSFDAYTEKLNEFIRTPEQQDKLKKYFDDVATNVRAIADLLREAGRVFAGLGDNPGIAKLADSLKPAITNLGLIMDQFTSEGASEGLGKLAEKVTDIILAFSDSQGIETFFNIMNAALTPIVAFIHSGFGKWIIGIISLIAAVTRSVAVLRFVFSKGLQIMLGGPIALLRALRRLKQRGIRGLFDDLKGSTKDAAKGLDKVGDASDGAMDALKRQMVVDKDKIKVLDKLAGQALEAAGALEVLDDKGTPTGAATAAAAAAAPDVDTGHALQSVDGIGKSMDEVATKKTGRFKGALKGIGGAMKGMGAGALALVGGPMGLLLLAIPALIAGFVALYKKSPQFKKFVDGIVGPIKQLVGFLLKWLLAALDKFFAWVNETLPKIGAWFGQVFAQIWEAVGPVVMKIEEIVKRVFPVIVTVIQTYVKIVWTVIKTYFTAYWLIIQTVFKAILWAVEHIVVPAFKLLWEVIKKAWTVIKFSMEAIWAVIKVVFSAIKWYAENIVIPVIKVIWAVFKILWSVAKAVFQGVWDAVKVAFEGIKWVWENVLRPVISSLRDAFQSVQDKVGTVVGWIYDKWVWFKDKFVGIKNAISGIVSSIRGFFTDLWTNVRDKVDLAKSKIGELVGKLDDVKTKISTKVKDIKGFFASIPGAIGEAFKDIGSHVAGGINTFIDFLNNKLIANINKITGKFGMTIGNIPKIPTKGHMAGGWTGAGPATKVAGIVHADEFVVKKSSRRAFESAYPGVLEHVNRTGQLPHGGVGSWLKKAPGFALDKLKDLGGATIGGIKNVGEQIAKLGLGKVLEMLVDGAAKLMGNAGIVRGPFVNDLFYGVMSKLGDAAAKWGANSGKQDPGGIPVYDGPATGWTYPLARKSRVSRELAHGYNAIDFAVGVGTAVRAATAGIVRHLSDPGGYGTYAMISHADGYETLYGHLSQYLKRSGSRVNAGDAIALSGNTGRSTGPHLHFEVRRRGVKLVPSQFMKGRGVNFYAKGGVAAATPGGQLAVVAEAGRPERMEPLDRQGMSKRDRVMMDTIRESLGGGRGGGGDTYNVYPAPGMDEGALAHMVSRRVAWKRSVGT